MPDALLTSFSSTLPPSTLKDVARHLSESPQSVSRGFELSAAAVLNRLADKSEDGSAMRRAVDTAFQAPANVLSSSFSNGIKTAQNAPWLSGAENFTNSLFGKNQQQVLSWISRESGLQVAAASTVLSLGAQSVLDRLGVRARQEGMTASSFAAYLKNERVNLRNVLPPGFQEALSTPADANPVIAQTIDVNPVVAQTVEKERSYLPWLLGLLVAALVLGSLWYFLRQHHPVAQEASVVTAPTTSDLGNFVQRQLPGGSVLNIPERGVEGRLLAFIQDPNRVPDTSSWFDFDRLLFDTGSATLQPQSQEQLHNIAAILQAYPNVHLKIGGYTDNVGSADANLKLSQDRATNVTNELIRLGISPDRLVAQGYGEDHPVADNQTDAGRALNRRISMLVTQK